ncbi:MAG: glycosyltransferase family 39 protein [Bacteroidota bacterium]
MKLLPKGYRFNWMVIAVLLLLTFRLVVNGALPLMDKTEARYAEIARLMMASNDWIMPQIDYGLPFWAKPPLSTWLSALSFKWFGVSEFTARLPSFLLSVLMALMLGKYAQRQQLSFWLPVLIVFTIPQFFLHAGVVSTDTALSFSVVLVMLSFWETVTGNKHGYWKYLFFTGIGLGLLVKGPIVVLLTLPPLFVWVWLSRYFKRVWLLFPWFLGSAMVIIIAGSWYYIAEKQSPGFVDYFIVGEHFRRFFDSSWRGDKYGFPKSQPFGMIWVFLLVFALPWVQVVLAKTIKNRKTLRYHPWVTFLLLWLVWTPLFFTISKSLIHPYILPVMVPLTLLVIFWWKGIKYRKMALAFAFAIPALAFAIFGYATISNKLEVYAKTDKYLIENVRGSKPIFHFGKKSYSGQFYSKGRLRTIQLNEVKERLLGKEAFAIIIKNKDTSKIPETILKHLNPLGRNANKGMYWFSGKGQDSLNTPRNGPN